MNLRPSEPELYLAVADAYSGAVGFSAPTRSCDLAREISA
jgi:hypothetical protein